MQDFEKLGVFYLGRPYDLASKQTRDGWLLYDSSDLVTHAVCVGMTGSGKTGLCIGLIEEAAIDGVPAIVIDPKGDLSDLLLTFPALRPSDFRPWINESDAVTKGLSPDTYAEQQAALWKKGLADWGEDGERIQRLKSAADFAVYTPGSSAGIPVSVLRSLDAPPQAVMQDPEAFKEQIVATTTALLALAGIDADPIKSRDHILVSTILGESWKAGRSLDLPALIQQIQSPPVAKIGVLDLESFYPAKERFGLAMAINNLLASPGFDAWLEGDPLDIGRMLHAEDGRPRVSIFSIAHLGDAERMFFVSFLLNRMIGWMRSQSGTSSLRAILYMDEIYGFFPPVANPPSKVPLLTLLKQARAFGLGVVLATQNPVDLDYKGLSNAGTWFIGRLQTERDKARVLDGLEGAATGAGAAFDRKEIDTILSSLSSRVFLMNNVHDNAPEVFQTRWTMSYLRGPMTREQIRTLMAGHKPAGDARPGTGAEGAGVSAGSSAAGARSRRSDSANDIGSAVPASSVRPGGSVAGSRQSGGLSDSGGAGSNASPRSADTGSGSPPILPPAVTQYFMTVRGRQPQGSELYYRPAILGSARIRFFDKSTGIDLTEDKVYTADLTDAPVPVDWDGASEANIDESDLERSSAEGARFGTLPPAASKPASYDAWSKAFVEWLVRCEKQDLLRSAATGTVSRPGETERDFRIRLQQASREERDGGKDLLQKKYAPKIAALTDKIRRAEQSVERESEQVKAQGIQTAISFGATLLGSFLGRKAIGVGTIGRATTAVRGVGRTMKESQDVGRAQETVESLKAQLADLEASFQQELQAQEAKSDPLTEPLATVTIRPASKDVYVRLVALVWEPQWRDAGGALTPAWM